MKPHEVDLLSLITIDDLNGVIEKVADEVGIETVIFLIRVFGGENFYVPSKRKMLRVALSKAVEREYDGTNGLDLALRYNTTRGTIEKLAAKLKADKETDGEITDKEE